MRTCVMPTASKENRYVYVNCVKIEFMLNIEKYY